MMVSAFDRTIPLNNTETVADRRVNEKGILKSGSPPSVSQTPFVLDNNFSPKKGSQGLNPESDPETEDEEVTMNCINGVQPIDFDHEENNDYAENDSDSVISTDSDGEDGVKRVATFVEGQAQPSNPQLRRPLPVVGRSQVQDILSAGFKLQKYSSANNDEDSSTGSSSSDSGARGCPIETSLLFDDGSEADSLESDSEEDQEDFDEQDDASLGSLEEHATSSVEESEYDSDSENEVDGEDGVADTPGTGCKDSGEEESDDERNHISVEDHRQVMNEPSNDGEIDALEEDWDMNHPNENALSSLQCRRPSLSMDEIEDMLEETSSSKHDDRSDESSDGEGILAKKSRCEKPAEEELMNLLSGFLEFDYWSPETLKAGVNILSSVSRTSYPISLPSRDDESFWVTKVGMMIFPESRLKQYISSNPDQQALASKILFDAFHSAMTSLDLTRIVIDNDKSFTPEQSVETIPNLFIGDFAAAESRLALAVHHIKYIIQISYHPLDELWKNDGIRYSTHILPSLGDGGAAPVHAAILMAAEEVASSMNEQIGSEGHNSVLVTCSTGDEHACAVCALYLAQRLAITKAEAADRVAKLRPSCRIDTEWLHSDDSPRTQKAKRVLSSNMLSGPSIGVDSPKRMRRISGNIVVLQPHISFLPDLDLGQAAQDPREGQALMMRGSEDYISSSAEVEVEEDNLRSEELEETNSLPGKPSTPVPLLTPPASPVRVNVEEGETTVCEWPSNLTVDQAMTAAAGLRPLSSNSLQEQSEQEKKRGQSPNSSTAKTTPSSTLLTPLIRGISVKFD